MKVDLVSVGSYQRKIEVLIPAQTVREELDTAFRSVGSRARIHGFRPGKIPRQVLEMRFGAQIRDDVARNLVQRAYSQGLEEHKLEPVSRPSVNQGDLDPSKDFQFTITVEVKPEVEIAQYVDLEVAYPKVEVGEDEIERAVKAKLEGQARLVEVTDRGAQSGDLALVELVAKDGDAEVAREPGTMIRMAGEPYYPGVEGLIEGMKVGEEKTGAVKIGENARNSHLAGRDLSVSVKVIGVQANEVPDLTEEIAKELGHESSAALVDSVKVDLGKNRGEMAKNQARANLLQALISKNAFDVPAGMVDQQLQVLVDELRLQQAYRGKDPRQVTFSQAQMADLRMRSEFAVKGGIILDYVSKKEKLAVTETHIEAKYQELAEQRDQTIEQIRGYFVKEGAVDELRARLLEELTLDWLLDHSKTFEGNVQPGIVAPGDVDGPGEAVLAEAAAFAEAEAAPAADGVDLSVLEGAVGAVKDALESGAHDANLAELLAAEEGGKARKGVIAAIQKRLGNE